jgi:hypothetical protein
MEKKYAERNLHLQQCLATLKGQYFQKNVYGIIYSPKKNNFILNYSEIKTFLLSAYMENMLNGEKSTKMRISRLLIEQYEIKI